MLKSLRYIAIIAICATLLFFGYHRYQKDQATKKQIDLTKKTVIVQFSNLQNLETASVTNKKSVEGKQEFKDLFPDATRDNLVQNFLFEDSLEMEIYAKFIAGFNLSGFSADQIQVDKDMQVTIYLPRAEILSSTLLPETKPFIRKRGILSQGDLQLETEIRNQALEQMKADAIEKGLLLRAEDQAKQVFTNFLGSFGIKVKDVVVRR